MRPQHVALYTTVYPAVERFLPDWIRSVTGQTDLDFDICIGVHDWDVERAAAALGSFQRLCWVPGRPGDSPARVRAAAIEWMVREYDAVVFADSDDLLDPSRVAAARVALSRSDVQGCALQVMGEGGEDLRIRFGPAPGEDLPGLLAQYNVFGLSNSAYRSECLAACLPLPDDCVLMDWFLASRAWVHGATLEFDCTPRMWYRQYRENTARVLGPFSASAVRIATDLVRGHYHVLFRALQALERQPCAALVNARSRVDAFHRSIAASSAVLQRYVEALNRLPVRYIWWWCVAHPELEDVWTN